MNPLSLDLAAKLSGTLLSAPEGGLLMVERVQTHGLPQVLVLGRVAADLMVPLEAIQLAQTRGLALNFVGLLPLPDCQLGPALERHARRLGANLAALDAGLPWLDERPMLVRRLPGRIFSTVPIALGKAPMGPLEKAELKAFLPGWDKARRRSAFRRPEWRETEGGFETELWPGVPLPAGTKLRVAPLELPVATPLADALRAALRGAVGHPVPVLPLPADSSPLHALRRLTPEATAFRGPLAAWVSAFERLAALPAPPHFCARC